MDRILKKTSALGEEYDITEQQVAVLNYIYEGTFAIDDSDVRNILFRVNARKLRKIFKNDASAINTLVDKCLIEKREIENDEYYYLKPEGLYLCIYDNTDLRLILVYCEMIKLWFNGKPDIDVIKSEDVEAGFSEWPQYRTLEGKPFFPFNTKRLWSLITFLKLYDTSKQNSCDGKNWYCSIPKDIEDLDAKEITVYLLDRYKKEIIENHGMILVNEQEIAQSDNSHFFNEIKGALNIIKESKLKVIIESDLRELGIICDCNYDLPKTKIIMCGIIVEALLLDILNRNPSVVSTYLKKPELWPHRATLEEMLKCAKEKGLISETVQINIFKAHRDLVHPYRAIKSDIIIDYTTADFVLSALKVICRDLQSADETGKIKEYEGNNTSGQ
jgi:hypothetical protein